ncbi:olfactory receptor 5P64-like [Gastrophryne carolinensis]
MCGANETQVKEFHLLGFQGLPNFRPLLFTVILLIFIMILSGNLIIVVLVSISENLKIPMYFFLKHLAAADVLLTTCIVPKLLETLIKTKCTISFRGCLAQFYFYCTFGFVQCFLIAVMSYDRYVAISNPLQYTLIMVPAVCFQLAYGSWALMFSLSSSEFIMISLFEFCGLSDLDHFFCDLAPLVKLTSSDTSALLLQDFIFGIIAGCFPFVFTVVTYIYIFITILKISSSAGRQKAFSTCSSHLSTVCTYYLTLIAIYMTPSSEVSSGIHKYPALLYVLATPLMNPIIYSLRKHEIRYALQKKFTDNLK